MWLYSDYRNVMDDGRLGVSARGIASAVATALLLSDRLLCAAFAAIVDKYIQRERVRRRYNEERLMCDFIADRAIALRPLTTLAGLEPVGSAR